MYARHAEFRTTDHRLAPGIRQLHLSHSTARLVDTVQWFVATAADNHLAVRIESATCRTEAFTRELARLSRIQKKRDLGFDGGRRGAMPAEATFKHGTVHWIRGVAVERLGTLRRGRQNPAKSVNAVLTTTYWLVGCRLVEFEQHGKERAV